MYEILLTRIFGVARWSHFALMDISGAMFRIMAGALLVYLFPSYFRSERTTNQLEMSPWLFPYTIVGSFLTHLGARMETPHSASELYPLVMT